MKDPEMIIKEATKADTEEIYALLKETFVKEAELFQDFNIPAIIQKKEEFEKSFSEYLYLKGIIKDKIIAVIRAKIEDDVCHIGRFAVHPDYQNKGIGTRLIKALEGKFPSVKSYELFTGILSDRNMHFYKKLGYSFLRKEVINNRIVFFLGKKLR